MFGLFTDNRAHFTHHEVEAAALVLKQNDIGLQLLQDIFFFGTEAGQIVRGALALHVRR
jgi:hypothetical protein